MLLTHKILRRCCLVISLFLPVIAWSDQTLTCLSTSVAPTIDGKGDDVAWSNNQELPVYDAVAGLTHYVSCSYNKERIFIKSRFKDATEDRTHKTGNWDEEQGLYNLGADREDTLVIKWNMTDNQGDISLSSNTAYKADVWYWKAFRTDLTGYADDKVHQYTKESAARAKKLISKNGNRFYLVRRGDKGTPTYKPIVHILQYADHVPSYSHRKPTGSRADVKAKGHWSDNQWTVEFSRLLNTGNADDVLLDTGHRYQLGLSRYEIAGQPPNPASNNALHGAGEITETISLIFENQIAEK